MRNIRKLLDIKLLSQPFITSEYGNIYLDEAKSIAKLYMRLENCISVLSDMKSGRSYIYYGAIAAELGLQANEEEINSIWEDELLALVHTQDLQKKYRLEFQFFHLLKSVDVADRVDYGMTTKFRVRNINGDYILIRHRIVYISSSADGSVWLALCLYNKMYEHAGFNIPEGVITNSKTGAVIENSQERFPEILSFREKEILQLIKRGRQSKEIANRLLISIHTVNRHRQNIFQKLNVTNSMEACRVAESLGLF